LLYLSLIQTISLSNTNNNGGINNKKCMWKDKRPTHIGIIVFFPLSSNGNLLIQIFGNQSTMEMLTVFMYLYIYILYQFVVVLSTNERTFEHWLWIKIIPKFIIQHYLSTNQPSVLSTLHFYSQYNNNLSSL
jgi:hypothetical protein